MWFPTKITPIFLLLTNSPTTLSFKYDYVTCGSLIKLYSQSYQTRLHSHEVAYGTGSGQQSVTAIEQADDSNSLWQIRGISEDNACTRGEPIQCGASVRLTHLNTKKNLHTHNFRSPLSNQQEVSAFGENGVGDDLDVWEIQCSTGQWNRNSGVSLYHSPTKKFLALSGKVFGRPIANQMEVIASKSKQLWKVMEGVYIKPTMTEEDMEHDEL